MAASVGVEVKSPFDEFCTAGEAAIDRWIKDALPEDEAIEFKSGVGLDKGSLARATKRHIGEELSALANSGGGVLFLGVGTAKLNGFDVPHSKAPIDEVDRFASQLKFQLDTLVAPPIPDLRFEVVHTKSDPSKGFVAIEVPRSARRPHMCRAPDLHTYFKRLGTSSVPMSPYEVEDQMLRSKNAEVSAHIRFEDSGSINSARSFAAIIILQNESDISAVSSWAGVDMEAMEFNSDAQKNFGFKVGPRVPKGRTFYAEPYLLIPPGGQAVVCAYDIYLARDQDGNVRVRQPGALRDFAKRVPKLLVQFGCLNTRQKEIGREMTEEDLEDLFDSGKLVIG